MESKTINLQRHNFDAHLTLSKFPDLSADVLASVLNAEALDSTFLSSTSAKSKSLDFTAFSNLDIGTREVWDGLMGRTAPAVSEASSLCSSVTPGIEAIQTTTLYSLCNKQACLYENKEHESHGFCFTRTAIKTKRRLFLKLKATKQTISPLQLLLRFSIKN